MGTRPPGNEQDTDSLGPIDLVRRRRQQVDRQLAEIERQLAEGLCGIDVQQRVVVTAQAADGGDVLDHARFVVDVHHGHELRVTAQNRRQPPEVQPPVRSRVQPAHFETLRFEPAKDIRDRAVFRAHRDQVAAARRPVLCRALDRQVVGLGRTGCPGELRRIAMQECRDLACRDCNEVPGQPAGRVVRRRIAAGIRGEQVRESRGHRRIDRCRGRIVEVHRAPVHGPIRSGGAST